MDKLGNVHKMKIVLVFLLMVQSVIKAVNKVWLVVANVIKMEIVLNAVINIIGVTIVMNNAQIVLKKPVIFMVNVM